MSLADGNGGLSAADVAAVMGNGGNSFGWGNDGAWWLIVLFLFAMNGGWGNGAFGGNGGAMYPLMMNQGTNNDVQRGFDQSAVMGGLNGLTSQVSNGFANAEISRCNGQTNILQALNANQAASASAMNGLAMSLQNCCCENRAATADLKYTVATEACADRAAVTSALTSLQNSTNAGFQAINDKLCQLELDGVKQRNADLLAENNALKFAQSQTAQDAFVQNAINNAINRVNPAPIPAYPVQNPNCCSQFFNGMGCASA